MYIFLLLQQHHGNKKEERGCINATKLEAVTRLDKVDTMQKVPDDYGVKVYTVGTV